MRHILRIVDDLLPAADTRTGCRRSILCRIRAGRHISRVLLDRLFVFVCIVLWPVLLLSRRRVEGQSIIFETVPSPDVQEDREVFLRAHLPFIEAKGSVFCTGRRILWRRHSGTSGRRMLRIWFVFLKYSFAGIADATPRSTRWLPLLMSKLWCQELIRPSDACFFTLMCTETYISALLISELCPDTACTVSAGNAVLYGFNRYGYLPKVRMAICSKAILPEFDYSVRHGWYSVGSSTVCGLEYPCSKEMEGQDPIHDVTLYTSAEWAREGLSRCHNLEKLRSGGLLDSPLYLVLKDVLDVLVSMKRQYGISVQVCTHPHERELVSRHKIPLPYWRVLADADIEYDVTPGRSVDKLFEAKVGVAVCSTIILDRWHYELDGYLYDGPEVRPYQNPDHMGEYAAKFYTSADVLRCQLTLALGLGEG